MERPDPIESADLVIEGNTNSRQIRLERSAGRPGPQQLQIEQDLEIFAYAPGWGVLRAGTSRGPRG